MSKNLQDLSKKEIDDLSRNQVKKIINDICKDLEEEEENEELPEWAVQEEDGIRLILEKMDKKDLETMKFLSDFSKEQLRVNNINKIMGNNNEKNKYLKSKNFQETLNILKGFDWDLD